MERSTVALKRAAHTGRRRCRCHRQAEIGKERSGSSGCSDANQSSQIDHACRVPKQQRLLLPLRLRTQACGSTNARSMAWELGEFTQERLERSRRLLGESEEHRGSMELQVGWRRQQWRCLGLGLEVPSSWDCHTPRWQLGLPHTLRLIHLIGCLAASAARRVLWSNWTGQWPCTAPSWMQRAAGAQG